MAIVIEDISKVHVLSQTMNTEQFAAVQRHEYDQPQAQEVLQALGALPLRGGEVALAVVDQLDGTRAAKYVNLDPSDFGTVVTEDGKLMQKAGLKPASEALRTRAAEDRERAERAIAAGNPASAWKRPGAAGHR